MAMCKVYLNRYLYVLNGKVQSIFEPLFETQNLKSREILTNKRG